MKKITSFIVTITLLMGAIGANATAEEIPQNAINYSDYEPVEKPESLMKWAAPGEATANRSGERGWMQGSRNCHSIDTDKTFDGNTLKTGWGTAGSYSPRAIYTLEAITGEEATVSGASQGELTVGADGMASTVYIAYDPSRSVNYFQMDNSKNYVFSINIKDNYPDVGPAALVNFAVSNESTATRAWSKEYGSAGFRVTGEYKTYAGTFDLPNTFNNSGKQIISAGFMVGNGAGESISFKNSELGDVYFAEEVAYDIENEITSGESGLFSGDSATFSASVVNQIGSEGYLDQNFTWTVVNADRTEEVDGFTVVTDVTTKNATLTVGDTVDAGTYTMVAISSDYEGFVKGVTFRVYDDDYYRDYVKGAMPANLIDNGTNRTISAGNGEYYFARNNSNVVRSDFTTVSTGVYTIKYAFNGSETVTTLPAAWANMQKFEGFEINGTNGQAGSYFTTEAGKSYVIGAKLKNVSQEGVTPYFGASMTMYTVDLGTHQLTKEYGATGMPIGTDWTEFKGTIKLPNTWQTTAHSSKVFFGMPAGTPAGAAFLLDLSTPNGFYFAEEVPYDITNTKIAGPVKLQTGQSATYRAEVMNQIGSKGYLKQNFTWHVMDTERTEFIDGFTVTQGASSDTVTVVPGATISTGRYSLVAVSEDYDMVMGADIRVIADDYYDDYESPAVPANILTTLYGESAGTQVKGFQRNNTSVQSYDNVEPTDDGLPLMTFTAQTDISYDQYRALDGWIINKTETNTFAKGDTYLFKIRARDASTEGNTAIINAVIHNETSAKLTHNWPLETGRASSGLRLTDEYEDYIFTIPVGDAFDVGSTKHYLNLGFIAGTFAGTAFEVDTTNDDSFYFAKEIVYDIKNTVKTGSAALKAGETVTLEAQVVNQLDQEGSLAQNFIWVALDTQRNNIIDGITITPSQDTKTATVSVSDSVELGTYTIVAVSEDYDIAKGINIEVVSAVEKISALEILEDSGYVMVNASVEDTTAENIFFVLAAYTNDGLLAVKSMPVAVTNGTASVTDMMFDDALDSGTIVKAFVWDYNTLKPISNPSNFVTSLTVQ